MNSELFINILSSSLASTASLHGLNIDDHFLQQDNDPKHTYKRTREQLNASNIHVLSWPGCSPDMNPIEHVWNDINIRIISAPLQSKNFEELKEAIQREWKNISPAYIKNLFDSMPRRIHALKAAKGGFTKY